MTIFAPAAILARAVGLADTEDMAWAAASMVGRCKFTGLDVRGYRGLIGCAVTLGMRPATNGAPWFTDREFINGLIDLEDDMVGRLLAIGRENDQLRAALEEFEDVEGCEHIVAAIHAALGILAGVDRRIGYSLRRLRLVPGELGDTYEAAYNLVRVGRKLPYDGRWITGATA